MAKINKVIKALATAAVPKQKPRTRRNLPRAGASHTLQGQDLVTFLPDTVVTQDNQIFAVIPCNPCYWTGTRISQIAAAYQAYTVSRFEVEYIPQVSVGYNGTVIAGTLWDGAPGLNALQQTLATSPGGRLQVCYRRFVSRVPLSGLQQRRFNTNGELAQSTNPFTFYAVVRGGQLAFQEPSTTQVVPGYFRVKYTYHFYNPIGSGWRYGVRYNQTIDTMEPIYAQNMSLISLDSFGTFGPGTIFDYEAGEVFFRGTKVDMQVPFNLYFNGTEVSRDLTSLGVGVKYDTITGIQINKDINDADSEWHDLFPYTISLSEAIPRGIPGKVTIRLLKALPSSIDFEGASQDYRWYLQAWYGISDWEIAINSFEPAYMFQTDLQPTESVWIRCKTKLGRHSTPIIVSQTLFDIGSAFEKQNPATVCLNYINADISFENADGEPIEPQPWQEETPSLSRPQGIPPKWGPKISDLDAEFATTLADYEYTPAILNEPVNEDTVLFWLENNPGLVYARMYFFHPSSLSQVTTTSYRNFTLYKLTSGLYKVMAYDTWFYMSNPLYNPNMGVFTLGTYGPMFIEQHPADTWSEGQKYELFTSSPSNQPLKVTITYHTKSFEEEGVDEWTVYEPAFNSFKNVTAAPTFPCWLASGNVLQFPEGTGNNPAYPTNCIFVVQANVNEWSISYSMPLTETSYNFSIIFRKALINMRYVLASESKEDYDNCAQVPDLINDDY